MSAGFGNRRPGYMMQYLRDFFGLSALVSLELAQSGREQGFL
jgi:hypothetical protein